MFDVHTAETLLQVHAAGVTREDFSELKQFVAEIAEEQKQIEATLQRLSEKIEQYRLMDDLEARLSSEEFEQLLFVAGKPKQQPEIEELYLTVEISSIVDKRDVQRARERNVKPQIRFVRPYKLV